MKIKSTFLLVLILSFASILISQTNSSFVSGEVMVQLKSSSDLPKLLQTYNLTTGHTVSERFNIYLLKFDEMTRTNNTVLNILKVDKSVVNVQNNHIISLRETNETIPNDSFFDDQWSLLNTGQASGTPGADIDATLAWDITTGGITALGDTIVIAIIDGGTDLNHQDLDFWKNRHEIPNNNIDDDNNGYIDDYDGWNAYNHSGDIPLNLHGVHVSGIAGAIGNNNLGITGVNWNVKTLPVAGDSNYETIVVEALSYIFVLRETYDQTNGEKGAFIVADNCSFGINEGNPANFPIWEAMYDSLGQLGILSMGATANRDWDIDVVGDVPTGFTTDYMIAVTNTTKNDVKYSNAGYGLTTIDLGAPGTTIKSLALNNSYTYKSGTSMATPHVCGAAALLMAAADSAFMLEYKNNPAQGALLIRNFLLNGVDQLEALEGITVTGGRLNIFNSIKLMLNDSVISTNIDSAYAEVLINTTETDTLIITNTGFDTLSYIITITNQPDWFTLSQYEGVLAGGEYLVIEMQFNADGIDTGYYNCTMDIDVDNIEGKSIPVQMYVYDNVGVLETNSVSFVKVFPNPFNTYVNFDFTVIKSGKSTIEIYDLLGKIVYFDEVSIAPGSSNFIWSNNLQPAGIYFYRLIHDNVLISSGKVVKK
ncbi:MAG: S8 family peptidase [Bacteroidota bacterium]